MTRSKNSNFGTNSGGTIGGVYTCRVCKKKTRETGECESNVELCAACYDYAGWVNTHSDNGHDDTRAGDPDCPICIEKAAERKAAERKAAAHPSSERRLLNERDKLREALLRLREIRDNEGNSIARDAMREAIAKIEEKQTIIGYRIRANREGFRDAVRCYKAGTHSELFGDVEKE